MAIVETIKIKDENVKRTLISIADEAAKAGTVISKIPDAVRDIGPATAASLATLAKGSAAIVGGLAAIPTVAAVAAAGVGVGLVGGFAAAVFAADDLRESLERVRDQTGFLALPPDVAESIDRVNASVDVVQLTFSKLIESVAGVAAPEFERFAVVVVRLFLGIENQIDATLRSAGSFGQVFEDVIRSIVDYIVGGALPTVLGALWTLSQAIIKQLFEPFNAFNEIISDRLLSFADTISIVDSKTGDFFKKIAQDISNPLAGFLETPDLTPMFQQFSDYLSTQISDGIISGASSGIKYAKNLADQFGVSEGRANAFIDALLQPIEQQAAAIGEIQEVITANIASPNGLTSTTALIDAETAEQIAILGDRIEANSEQIARNFAISQDNLLSVISQIGSGSLSGIGSVVGSLSNIPIIGWIASFFEAILAIISDPSGFVEGIKTGIFDAILSAFKNLGTLLPELVGAIGDFVAGIIPALIESVPRVLLSLPTAIVNLMATTFPNVIVEGIIKSFSEWPKVIADGMGAALEKLWEQIKTFFEKTLKFLSVRNEKVNFWDYFVEASSLTIANSDINNQNIGGIFGGNTNGRTARRGPMGIAAARPARVNINVSAPFVDPSAADRIVRSLNRELGVRGRRLAWGTDG